MDVNIWLWICCGCVVVPAWALEKLMILPRISKIYMQLKQKDRKEPVSMSSLLEGASLVSRVTAENARGQGRQARLVWDDRGKQSHNSNNPNQDMQRIISEHTNLKADGLRQHGTAQGAACVSLEGKRYNSHWGGKNLTREEFGGRVVWLGRVWPGLVWSDDSQSLPHHMDCRVGTCHKQH